MRLRNLSDAPAGFLNTCLGDEHLMGAVIARPSYRIEPDGSLTPDAFEWPVELGGAETALGPMLGDQPFLLGGCDLMVVGSAVNPGNEARESATVELRVGSHFRRTMRVWGDRTWVPSPAGPRPGPAQPFVEMPLTYARAFGGTVSLPAGEYGFPPNPHGTGFYLSADEAIGKPLPNLEHPDRPIRQWDDKPEPWCWAPYPREGALRAVNAADIDESGALPRLRGLKPTAFNHAHPALIIPATSAPTSGDPVQVLGMNAQGPLQFLLPELRLHTHVQLEDRNYVFPMHLDQILVAATDRRLVLSFRAAFRYRMVPMERRCATIRTGAAPRTVPADYAQTWGD